MCTAHLQKLDLFGDSEVLIIFEFSLFSKIHISLKLGSLVLYDDPFDHFCITINIEYDCAMILLIFLIFNN